ncbi:Fur family transcriptional regulator [Longimicrobium terrae]|uniref:Fur family ferric uptake transcriptional regulator n=1 Tax=Longimicrobium terrae TaxID=1639882 RepID=A0A841GLK6_9BACT|nr:transcriptional repressor [Longimicrobium terrae]MBB4635083.1 Fur family ferric uptake transcriptional regulator [Longimicrobium terrae]MBB6069477.1 Fur family ferric uptake transcriptional regulator [Longimicrobium terrae]NNC31720.1 transcriptional repressor [Longimicrobium terrae]
MAAGSRLGERNTRQRDTIAEVIRDAAGPLTVPEIFERSQQSIPGLGIATVYRTVKLLSEAGQLQAVILPSGETRYESAQLGHHHHFHCRVCQTVYDMQTCLVRVPESRSVDRGFVIESHELTCYGVCPACA